MIFALTGTERLFFLAAIQILAVSSTLESKKKSRPKITEQIMEFSRNFPRKIDGKVLKFAFGAVYELLFRRVQQRIGFLVNSHGDFL